MMRKIFYVGIVIAFLACDQEIHYIGDGKFLDRGTSEAVDQYVLDLGIIKSDKNNHRIGHLPSTRFVVGFHESGLDEAQAEAEAKRSAAKVEMVLTRSDGEKIFTQKADLSDWIWTCSVDCMDAFGYRKKSEEMNGDPGTYFVPQKADTYNLSISIIAGDVFFKENHVSILFRGGGWK